MTRVVQLLTQLAVIVVPATGWFVEDWAGGVKGFVTTSLAFCAAHGVFLAAVLFRLSRNGDDQLAEVDWRSVGFGCLIVLTLLLLDFVLDLVGLRQWSFWQLEQTAHRGISRVMVVHLTLLIGLFGIAVTGAPHALFGAFVILKSLVSLSWLSPRWEPDTVPKWLGRVVNRLPRVRRGTSFEDEWARDRADEVERRARNDQAWVSAGH